MIPQPSLLKIIFMATSLAFSAVSCGKPKIPPPDLAETLTQMDLDDFTINFADLDRNTILVDWHWLTTEANVPILITIAGDAFVQNTDSGAISFLNTADCSLAEIAPDKASFQGMLLDKGFVGEHFRLKMMAPLLAAKPRLPQHQLYSLRKPLILGGELDAENLEPSDLEVHFSILGQICRQVRNLPAGGKIRSVKIHEGRPDDETVSPRGHR